MHFRVSHTYIHTYIHIYILLISALIQDNEKKLAKMGVTYPMKILIKKRYPMKTNFITIYWLSSRRYRN